MRGLVAVLLAAAALDAADPAAAAATREGVVLTSFPTELFKAIDRAHQAARMR